MIEIVSAVGGSVAATLLANFVWEKRLRDRLRIRRVERQDSRDVAGMLALYATLFPDETRNYTSDDILSLLPDRQGRLKRKHTPCTEILLSACIGKSVVGFLFCHYYPASSHAIVSYCGQDPNSEIAKTQDAVGQLLAKLLKILNSQKPPCSNIIFEVSEPSVGRTFRIRAIRMNLTCKELLVGYRRPKYSLDAEAEGESLRLLSVPLTGSCTTGVFTLEDTIALLNTLHVLGYGDYYDPQDPRHHQYQTYLRRQVESYRARLPDPINVS